MQLYLLSRPEKQAKKMGSSKVTSRKVGKKEKTTGWDNLLFAIEQDEDSRVEERVELFEGQTDYPEEEDED